MSLRFCPQITIGYLFREFRMICPIDFFWILVFLCLSRSRCRRGSPAEFPRFTALKCSSNIICMDLCTGRLRVLWTNDGKNKIGFRGSQYAGHSCQWHVIRPFDRYGPRHILPKIVRMLIFDVWSESPSKTYVVFRFIKHRFCINIACMFLVWLFLLVVHVFSNQLLVRLRHCMFVRLRHCMFTCLTLFHAECSFSVVCQAHGLKAQDPLAKAQGAHGTWAVCLLPIAHELCYGAHQMCPFILPITQPTNSAH